MVTPNCTNWRHPFVALAVLLVGECLVGLGCASGQYATPDNNRVRMPSFELTIPPDRAWFFKEQREPFGVASRACVHA